VRVAAKDSYKFSSLVLGIVNSEAFRRQGAAPKPAAKEAEVLKAANPLNSFTNLIAGLRR
jgi:hypothetical protein